LPTRWKKLDARAGAKNRNRPVACNLKPASGRS
jgi:hypothetical protein